MFATEVRKGDELCVLEKFWEDLSGFWTNDVRGPVTVRVIKTERVESKCKICRVCKYKYTLLIHFQILDNASKKPVFPKKYVLPFEAFLGAESSCLM